MVGKKQSKWGEIGDDVIKLIGLHWWKVILIITVLGIMATGYTCDWNGIKIKKDSVFKYEKKLNEDKETYKKEFDRGKKE